MQRHRCPPRPDWREKVEAIGLTYHTHDDGPYWDETACYEFTAGEIDVLERAAHTLHYLCIDAAEQIIARGWWDRLAIPEAAIPVILRSWERDDFSLYGRFDLAFDGRGEPKLLEYNADTPTALVEAAVAQWFWLQDTRPAADQFNSLHERLIEAWRRWAGTTVHFCSVKDNPEDEQTVLYLRDTALQAGVDTRAVHIEDLGWAESSRQFVDLQDHAVTHAFKLYPWEWLWPESFGQHLAGEPVRWIEPAWKMLLSNKGLLPVLWELYPDHPHLLPAFETPAPLGTRHVRKPKLSREGANVTWFEGGVAVEESTGDYGEEGFVYQAAAELPVFDGHRPICGVWVVDHEPAGLGLREDSRRITGNLSRFVPHFFPGG
ncbi:MAG: glutathionylspermidine synthase family protein [Verrucomicrobia bacterium]|nr:glutathionylspermidine synthase family protein [Verrucomicrobiota bacterium]